MKYLLLDIPPSVANLQIKRELRLQILQKEFFEARVKIGPEIAATVFQPIFEDEGSELCAIFVAPGENHLVFRDEIAPTRKWDEWYRGYRIWSLGRSADIESIELIGDQVIYHWCLSFLNLYETGIHYSGKQRWTGNLYSSTWNHMLANRTQLPIMLRGGYREAEPVIYYGERDAAEEYAKSL